jgi:hypothetical protein
MLSFRTSPDAVGFRCNLEKRSLGLCLDAAMVSGEKQDRGPMGFGCWRKLLIVLGLLIAISPQMAASIALSVQAEGDSVLLVKTPGRHRYITDAAQVRIQGDLGDTSLRLALLIAHDSSHAIYPENGKFDHLVSLEAGSNMVEIELADISKKREQIEVIRLLPHRLQSLSQNRLGGSSETLIHGPPDQVIQTAIPYVIAELTAEGNERIHLRVYDQYGNPVQVRKNAGVDAVQYTLREGMNSLVFRSMYDGKVFGETQLNFELSNVLQLLPDNTPEMVWFEPGSAVGQFRTSRSEFRFHGLIDAMESGVVHMSFGDSSVPLEVKNRRFKGSAPLKKDHLNLLRFSVRIEDQTYYESLEIAHVTPKLAKRTIRPVRFENDGIHLQEPISAASGDHPFFTNSPLISISGEAVLPGSLPYLVRNLSTGSTTEASSGTPLHALVPLRPARNDLELLAGGESDAVSLGKTTVFLRDFLTIQTVNGLPYEGEIAFIDTPDIEITGTIPAVSAGSLFLESEGEYYEYPIENGAFTTHFPSPNAAEKPVPIRLLWHTGNVHLQRTLFVQSAYDEELQVESPGGDPSEEAAVEPVEPIVP